uniref:DUF4378 domain-containing protein n=1 Tax=Kalanchoe fedtschenkoi TaxID=63787 RepID=A0A7N0U9Y2_KALFE
MGSSWRRKSVVESIADRSAELPLDSSEAAATGASKIRKQRISPKLVSESSVSAFGSSDKYSGGSYSGPFTGSSIKKLLFDEMSNERVQKRRSPSVIARLMGFEGLSLQQPTHKQLTNTQAKPQMTEYENYSHMRTSKQYPQFKDVYEVSESVKGESQGYRSRRSATSELSEAEIAFVRQKFIDAKRLATDEKFQGSKEFNDALEVLESNKDLFLKLLQEPNSMLTKHLHDLRRAYPHSQCSHTISKEPKGNQRHGNKDMGPQVQREILRNNGSGTPQKLSNVSAFYGTHRHDNGNLKNWHEGLDDRSTFPTKIVVLKPNLRRIQVSKPASDIISSASEFENSKKSQNIRIRDAEQRGKKHLNDDLQLPRHNAGESGELARRITQKMRGSLRTRSLDFTIYGLQDYNGGGSSSYESGNESSNGSDSRSSTSYSSNRTKLPLSHLSGSSVNKEARKRLSERWKMTQRFQEVGLSKSSTLGEMLSIPETTKESEIVILARKATSKDSRLNSAEEQARPLGISSRDGWKYYGQVKSLSSSASVPASLETLESTMRCKVSDDKRHLMRRMSHKDPSKTVKEIPRHKEELGDRRSRKSKSDSHHFSNITENNYSSEYTVSHIKDTPVCDEIPHEKEIIASEASAVKAGLVIDEVQDAQQGTLAMSVMPLEEYHHIGPTFQSEFQSPNHDTGIFDTQTSPDKKFEGYATPLDYLSVGPQSPSKSKDAELPSPMSVLGIPFPDDPSPGTECFGSLTADLQGLRMQLRLLKQESDSYAGGSMAISSSEDDEESTEVSEKRSLLAVDSLDSSYILDALTNSGFYDDEPHSFSARCHPSDYPMSPAEFEKLEEKYGEQAIWSRSERRILFDLINSGLVEIFRQCHDPHPWVKQSSSATLWSKSSNIDELEEKLLNWLQIQRTQENDALAAEKTIVKELEWYDSGRYIDEVGSWFEDLLTDELIKEILESWCEPLTCVS